MSEPGNEADLPRTAEERQRALLGMARSQGQVKVSELAGQLHVSAETVRRDLSTLEQHGLIRRAYGVAYPVESAGYESDLIVREITHLAQKRSIAEEAVRHVEDAETIFIDEGYTPQLIARMLPPRALVVVTASLPIAVALGEREDIEVYMLGGRVRGKTLGTVDHWATQMLAGFVIDLAFIGANAISRKHGLTTPDPAVSEVKATAMRVSRRTIFTGVSPKFTASSFAKFADVADLDLIVTDRRLPETEAARFAAMGPAVIRV